MSDAATRSSWCPTVGLGPLQFTTHCTSIDRSRAAGLKVCRSCSKTYDGTQHWSCPHCKAAKKLAATPIKTCPFCAEKVLAAAIKCKHCGSELPAGAPLP